MGDYMGSHCLTWQRLLGTCNILLKYFKYLAAHLLQNGLLLFTLSMLGKSSK